MFSSQTTAYDVRVAAGVAFLSARNQGLKGFETPSGLAKNPQGLKNLEDLSADSAERLSQLISNQFSNFFNAYAKAFNKERNRKGSLFMHTYKRILITDENYRRQLVLYIHLNPVQARLCKSPEIWPHSSYALILSDAPEFLHCQEAVSWFYTKENFGNVHTIVPV